MFVAIVPLLTGLIAVGYLFYWVFTDAPTHGLNPYKWALIGIVLPPVGLFVYLRRRAQASDELADDDLFGFTKHQ